MEQVVRLNMPCLGQILDPSASGVIQFERFLRWWREFALKVDCGLQSPHLISVAAVTNCSHR